MSEQEAFIHPSATVEPGAVVGSGSRVWHHCHLRSGASIGDDCVLGMNVFVDAGVVIGNAVKIQNNVSVYRGVELAAGVFVGPSAVFTNDLRPRAQKTDWQVSPTVVGYGASVGANATVVAGVEIGEHAMVGAGAVVTRTVRSHELVVGNPARHQGWVCRCGEVVSRLTRQPVDLRCTRCQRTAQGERSMPQKRIPLAVVQTGAAEQEAVLAVLRSGNLAGGTRVAELEQAFAAVHGARHAVAVSNGTTALVAALRAHGIGPGHEVITSPLTFVATLNAILEVGATARFAEVSAELTVDPHSMATLVTSRTRALLPVHLYGLPADMESVNAIACSHGLAVIQDAAQAHAAELGPDPIGRFSTATFSFYATKNITCGEGGMITTNDDRVAERLLLLRNHGMRKRYDYALPGYNYRLTDLQAAIASVQLSRLPELTLRRAHNAARLSAGLAGLSGLILPAVPAGRRHVWHQYTVRVTADARIGRDQLAKFLDAVQIEARPYYPRLVHDYPCYKDHPQVIADETPRAERAAEEVLSLPVHPALQDHDIDRIIAQVGEALGDGPPISAPLNEGMAADG